MERAFIREELKANHSPFARFYLTLKAHKLKPGQTVDQLKSRPNRLLPRQPAPRTRCLGGPQAARSNPKNNIVLQKYAGAEKTTARATPPNERTIIHCRCHVYVHQNPNTHGS